VEVQVLCVVPQGAIDRCVQLPGVKIDNRRTLAHPVTDGVQLCFSQTWPSGDRETLSFATIFQLSGMLFRERIPWLLTGLDFADE
jgi:hypothetical protein